MGWENHRNAKDFSRAERISMGLANTGAERGRRNREAVTRYAKDVESLRTARGGATAAPKREKLSWSEKRAADKILKEGKPKRGKK